MATAWDRAAPGFAREWVPRFAPYHLDLVREAALCEGDRVLVPCVGPGSEAVAVARAVGEKGWVRATDLSAEMVALCKDRVDKAAFTNVLVEQADAADTAGAPFDAVVCAFGLWQFKDRQAVLSAWKNALGPKGKVCIAVWGPPDEEDPFETMARCLRELEPECAPPTPRQLARREPMEKMFHDAGLSMVRHTVVRHTMSFASADGFVRSFGESSSWRRVLEELGEVRFGRVAELFCREVGGAATPIAWSSPATLAIAAIPGAEIDLGHRPSVRVPV